MLTDHICLSGDDGCCKLHHGVQRLASQAGAYTRTQTCTTPCTDQASRDQDSAVQQPHTAGGGTAMQLWRQATGRRCHFLFALHCLARVPLLLGCRMMNCKRKWMHAKTQLLCTGSNASTSRCMLSEKSANVQASQGQHQLCVGPGQCRYDPCAFLT